MHVKLDWQVDEDGDDLDWGAPVAAAQPGPMMVPAYNGLERHPELMGLKLASQLTQKEKMGRLYLAAGAAVFLFLMAMCIFV